MRLDPPPRGKSVSSFWRLERKEGAGRTLGAGGFGLLGPAAVDAVGLEGRDELGFREAEDDMSSSDL